MALNPYDPRLDSFRSDPNQVGIDLKRSMINSDPGVFVADVNATFQAGQILAYNAAGNVVLCNGTSGAPLAIPLGYAKWNKNTGLNAATADEAIVLVATTATNLKKANLFPTAAGVKVNSLPNSFGTVFVETTDFTVNYTNGQITRVGGGGITSGQTVYVTYQYAIPAADFDFQGRNFWNFVDDVTINQGGRIAIVTGWSLVFTTGYDPSLNYSIGQKLFVDGGAKAGLLTSTSGGGRPAFGYVSQLPSATDPYLGVLSIGVPQ